MRSRTILWCLLSMLLVVFTLDTAQAQRKKQNRLKRKNRLISRFTTKKQPFPSSYRYTTVEFGVSAFNYFGDLAPTASIASTDLNFTRPGISLALKHKFGPQFFMRSEFSWGRLQGDDYDSANPEDNNGIYRYIRNLHFRNDVKELNLTGMITLFQNRSWFSRRSLFNPYLFGGVAVLHHNPKALVPETDGNGNTLPDAGKWVALQPLGTEGQHSEQAEIKPYSLFQLAIPVGAGVSLKINNRVDMAFEVGYRYLFFDYIDDVSSNYVDKGILNDPLAKVLSDRSLETTAAISGDERDFEAMQQKSRIITYTGNDGQTYSTFSGFGHTTNGVDNIRGNSNNNDIYMVTTIRLSYILGGGRKKANTRILDFR